jgi:hypothetical protein
MTSVSPELVRDENHFDCRRPAFGTVLRVLVLADNIGQPLDAERILGAQGTGEV